MIKKLTPFYFLCMLLLTSCGSYKDIPYFQDLERTGLTTENIENYKPLLIKKGDILAINVSSKSPESNLIFNYNLNRVNGSNFDTSRENPVTGYLVNEKGKINVPLLGTVNAAGSTTDSLSLDLNLKLGKFLLEPMVNIRIINLKVSVYGDVARPNTYTLQSERTTITQALSLAGDLNITGKRKNIILIREKDGKRNYIPIDLTSKKFFQTEYYYLQNNDEIYVQPDRTKYATVDRGYRTATLVLSGLSIIAIVLSNLYR
jgi:polysaccharide export outer membrane protein